jgi:ADP-heptose:LPS heptosyltransferase
VTINRSKISIWIPSPGIGDFIVRIPAIKLINKYYDIILFVSFPESMDIFFNYLIPDFSGKIVYESPKYFKTPRDIIKKHFIDLSSIFKISECKINFILIDDNSFCGFLKYWLIILIKFYKSKCFILKPTLNLKYPFLINIEIPGNLFKIERYFKAANLFLGMNGIIDHSKYQDYFVYDLVGKCNRKILIAPGGKYKHQIWPYYKQLNKSLNDMGFEVILIGTGDEYELLYSIAEDGQTVLLDQPLQTICLNIKESRLIICNDSGILHLAAYLGAQTICICGYEFGKAWTGYTLDHVNSIYYREIASKNKKQNHYNSLKLVKLDDVLKKIESVLKLSVFK